MNQKNIVKDIQSKLFELQDIKYRDFHAKLMPTVNKEKIIGVRIPVLRSFAKEFGKTKEARLFLLMMVIQRQLRQERQGCFYKCFHIRIMKKIICMVFY